MWLSWQKKRHSFEAKVAAALLGISEVQDVQKSPDVPLSHIPKITIPKLVNSSGARVTSADHSKVESAEAKDAEESRALSKAETVKADSVSKEQLDNVLDEAWEYLSGKDDKSVFAEPVS